MDIKKVGQVCKDYRINVLDLSLTKFAEQNKENLQNIHAFEKGRANNIKYLYMYMGQSEPEQLETLLGNLFKEL